MTPSFQVIDTATIAQPNTKVQILDLFPEEHTLLDMQARIRALQTRWEQVKTLSESELIQLWTDTLRELFPCGCTHSRGAIRRVENVSVTTTPPPKSFTPEIGSTA